VLVVNRFRVQPEAAEAFRADLAAAVEVLSQRPGFVGADAGRNVDDPILWVLVTRWADVGSYRRALSAYDVKLTAVPLLSRAVDEPSAFEGLDGELNESVPRTTG
jgi:quinol monooxygenase YgiN